MAKLDSIQIKNPTNKDFTWNYNGEPYTIPAGESVGLVSPVAFHLAKHLSTKMIQEEVKSKMTKKDRENPNSAVHLKISQLAIYDTHERRIALYQILGDELKVLEVIKQYPFKGFIGEMSKYEDFVSKSKKKQEKSEESKSDNESVS